MHRLPFFLTRRAWSAAATAIVLVAIAVLLGSDASATVYDTFEIDADHKTGLNFAKAGYYTGIQENTDDWAINVAIPFANTDQDSDGDNNDGLLDCQTPPGNGAQPVFLACNADRADVTTCYGSRIVGNPDSVGQEVLLCDGNADGSALQAEQDIVSSFSNPGLSPADTQNCSEQKTNDRRWCLRLIGSAPLNIPNKSDETHGYAVINRTALCPDGPDPDSDPDLHSFIIGGYERLGNEGTVFAGFVFAQKAPAFLSFNTDANPDLEEAALSFKDQGDGQGTRRRAGDILVLLNQTGSNTVAMSLSTAGADTNGDGVPDFPPPTAVTVSPGPCGSFAAINADGDRRTSDSILAPPWLGNFCDPTAAPTGGSTSADLIGTSPNQCKVIGNTPPPCTAIPPCPAGGNLVPDQDFVEFALDLTAAGIGTNLCDLTNLLMTSRSSDSFTADLKDVATSQFAPLCGAAITIAPDDVNEVGESHTFTVTVSQTINGVTTPVSGVVPAITFPAGAPGSVDTSDCDAGTDANGQCDVIISSDVSGTFTAKATASVTVGGSTKNVSTDPAEGGAGNATKVFVNALINLTPATATNEVGTEHEITCTIQINAGDGAGFVNAPDDTICDANIDSGDATFVGGNDTCTVDGGDGNCILTITSAASGTNVISACTSGLVVETVDLSRCTDGAEVDVGFSNGSTVQKIYVNALINLSPATASNEVNDAHEITCTIQINAGAGAGFVNAPDTTVCDANIDSGSAAFVGGFDTCAVDGGDGNCILTINSAVSGTNVISACTSGLAVETVALSRCTDGAEVEAGFSNGSTVEKIYVNALITLTPATDTNEVNDDHEITCEIDINDGSGWSDAPDGTVCDANIDSGSATFVGGADTCAIDGGDGNCILTINSAVSGTNVISACTSGLLVETVPLSRCTDGAEVEAGFSNGGTVQKIYVNALITLTPATDTNEVNDSHEITCAIQINAGAGAGFVNAPDGTVCDANIDSGAATFVGGADTCTVDGGDANCILTINSAVAGTNVISACTSGLTVGGVALLRCTDGAEVEAGFSNSDTVEKVYVNALITLTPSTDTNEVNDAHEITCTILINKGDGAGFVNAPDSETCDANIDSGSATFVGGADTCAIDGGDGNCILTINSAVSGTNVISACTSSLVVETVALSRCTDGQEVEAGFSNGGTVQKIYVNALITLTPATDTNEVNDAHEITCAILVNAGDALGFVNAPDGTVCDANIDSGAATFVGDADTCAIDGDDGNCILTINSAVAGTNVISACTSSLVVETVALSRCTDGAEVEAGFSNGDTVEKVYVNAIITLNPPTDTNPVGTTHDLTCHIEVNDGSGAGFVNAPAGTTCDADLDSGPGDFVAGVDSCTTVGTTGSCIITITSDSPGTTMISACTEEQAPPGGLTVGGVLLSRCTDGAEVEAGVFNSDPAEKIWVLGSIRWEKRDDQGNLQGGATFTVGGASGPFACDGDATNPVTVVDDGTNDADPVPGQILLSGVCAGTYTVTETVPPPGFAIDDDPDRVVIVSGDPAVCQLNPGIDCGFDVVISLDFENRLGSITWEKRDDLGNLQGGATFTVDPNPFDCHNGTVGDETDAITVVDNGLNDEDGTEGEISIDRVCLGTYTICETVAPAGFAIDDDECREDIVVDSDHLDVTVPDDFVNRLGTLEWEKRDESQTVNNEHPLQGGATFQVFGGDTANAANGDGEGPFACQDTNDDGADEANPVLVADDVDGTTDLGDIDQDPDPGQFKLARVCTGTYTIFEFAAPDGYAKDDDADRVETVSDDNNGIDDDDDTVIDDAEELNAVVGAQGVDDEGNTDESDFHNRRGTLLFEKRSKNRSLGLGETELVGGASFRITPDPLGGTHSCGAGTVEDPTVTDCLEVTDGGQNDSFAATDGRICIDGVALTTTIGYTIQEVASNNPAYAIDDDDIRGPVSVTTSTSCGDRVSDPADADYFENTPLSEIEIEFRSLAGDGVTQLEVPIDCEPVAADDTDDDSPGSDPLHPYDDATLDRNEIFTNLEPGLYNCTVHIDP